MDGRISCSIKRKKKLYAMRKCRKTKKDFKKKPDLLPCSCDQISALKKKRQRIRKNMASEQVSDAVSVKGREYEKRSGTVSH